MTGPVTLTVVVDEESTDAVLPARAGDRLGVADGETVTIQHGVDGSVATAVRIDGDVSDGRIRLSEDLSDRLGVDDGETVTVGAAAATEADSVTVAPVPRLAVRGGSDLLREAVGDRPLTVGETVSVSLFDGSLDIPFRVVSTAPRGPVTVGRRTAVQVDDGPAAIGPGGATTPLPASAVGGYEAVSDAVVTALDGLLGHDDGADGVGDRRAGFLLEGAHGVGKTHLLRYGAWATDATITRIPPHRLLSADVSTVVDRLEASASTAQGSGRGIVHLDGIDTVAEDGAEATMAAVREWLDRVQDATNVAVVVEAVDAASVPRPLRQGARLSKTVAVPEPGRDDRAAILSTLSADAPTTPAFDVSGVARRAFGYVAADLVSLWLSALDAARDRADQDGGTVSTADLERGLDGTEPSGLDGSTVDVPTTTFDDIGGLEDAKRELTRAVEWPLTDPTLFERLSIDPPAGVLLYGPPGTGKTMLARAVASTSDANFVAVNGPELMNRYVGESERAVRSVFERARSNAPSVLFFDEVDAVGAARGDSEGSPATARVVSQLLTELDGLEGRGSVTVIGATNRPDRLDDALVRPGRFDRTVRVPMPDAAARAEIFRVHLTGRTGTAVDFDALAERTDGYTGSDIAAVVREAGLLAIESRMADNRGANPQTDEAAGLAIEAQHLRRALETVDPSLSSKALARYESFERPE